MYILNIINKYIDLERRRMELEKESNSTLQSGIFSSVSAETKEEKIAKIESQMVEVLNSYREHCKTESGNLVIARLNLLRMIEELEKNEILLTGRLTTITQDYAKAREINSRISMKRYENLEESCRHTLDIARLQLEKLRFFAEDLEQRIFPEKKPTV